MSDFYCDQVVTGKIKVDVLFETSLVMAFHHTKPYFEKHIVIIPKIHISSLSEYPNATDLNHDMFKAISFVSQKLETEYGGCRVSSNVGSYQTTKHLHWYVHSGKRLRDEDGRILPKA